jgi:hypothetical protein
MHIYDILHKNLFHDIIILLEDGLCRPKYVGEFFFPSGVKALLEPRQPHCGGFEITHRHARFIRTPLDERSACRRNYYDILSNC